MSYKKIIDFWFFEIEQKYHFVKDEKFDLLLKKKFEKFLKNQSLTKSWENYPLSSLSKILILDQFSRNIYRGDKKSFSFDKKALKISKSSIKNNFDKYFDDKLKMFFYMPLMHSENLEDQKLCVKKFTELSKNNKRFLEPLEFAKKHMDQIKKFGRFPFRNEVLNRKSTKAEILFMSKNKAF